MRASANCKAKQGSLRSTRSLHTRQQPRGENWKSCRAGTNICTDLHTLEHERSHSTLVCNQTFVLFGCGR